MRFLVYQGKCILFRRAEDLGEMANIVLSTERSWGLFFRSARSHSKTAPNSSLGLVGFASMVLFWGELRGKRMLFRGAGNPGEMASMALSTERSWGLFFRSARSHSKTAPNSSLGMVGFANMVLFWGELWGKCILFWGAGNPGEMASMVLSTERSWGLFFRSARSHSKTAPNSSLGLVSSASMVLPCLVYVETRQRRWVNPPRGL